MRALIVEDESVIRNGMRRHVDWENCGVEEVYTAANAQEAFAVCKTAAPDFVISDICMPGMNGIDLCRALRKNMPELEIIFVTGYEDKEYLKAAIDLGVVGYVEKPIRIAILKEKITEAVRRVNERKKKNAACLYTFLQDCTSEVIYTGSCRRFCTGIAHFRKNTELDDIKTRLSEELQPELEKQGIFFQVERIEGDAIVFLLGMEEETCFAEMLKEKIAPGLERMISENTKDWFLAFGETVTGKEKITSSYWSARETERMLAFLGWNQCAYFDAAAVQKGKTEIDKTAVYRFRDAIAQKNVPEARKILQELFETLIRSGTAMDDDIKYICYSMENTLNRAQKELCFLERNAQQLENHFLETAETYEEIRMYFEACLANIFEEKPDQKNHSLLNSILEYMEQHYMEKECSISHMAEHLYLTPTYLSAFFKKSTGKTIGNYLLEIRVEKAKRLLRDPQLKFYHVAEMVGYEDANYFAKVFKKKTGLTPSDYKKSLELK